MYAINDVARTPIDPKIAREFFLKETCFLKLLCEKNSDAKWTGQPLAFSTDNVWGTDDLKEVSKESITPITVKAAKEIAAAFVPGSCEDEVIEMLIDLHRKATKYKSDGLRRRKAYFNAGQNAIVARNAELYYRRMIQGGTAPWNIRDTHMMDTLTRLLKFRVKDTAKSIVWAQYKHRRCQVY